MTKSKGFKVGKSLREVSKKTQDKTVSQTRLKKGDCCR